MTSYALAAIGHDRPGIVAAISQVLFDAGCNVTDSSMTMLRGNFAVMLVFDAEGTDAVALNASLAPVCEEIGLFCSVLQVDDRPTVADPTHILTVYGADRPGILARVSAVLADADVNITDLNSRLLEGKVYALMLEITIPTGAEIDAPLRSIIDEVGVDITLRELEGDVL